MSKIYDYKKMIQLYVSIPKYDYVHKDFRDYREKLVTVLEDIFGVIPDDKKDKSERLNDIENRVGNYGWSISILFGVTIEYLRQSEKMGVVGNWLEGGPQSSLRQLRKKHSESIIDKIDIGIQSLYTHHKIVDETRYQLLYDIFVLFHGENNKIITSEDLLKLGFDDSKEPKISDYYDYF